MSSSLKLLAHRGPDGEGIWASPGAKPPFVILGHRRLAIIDLSDAAAQPMSSDDGELWITYNGEIYNYIELMMELEAKGYRFRSHSDTEVILKAYEEWGEACLARFNGMFAFAIWDERKRELFAARDRFGEKPFHYIWDPRRGFFAFASEIKALLALPEVEHSLDERALYRFVAFQELAGSEQTLWRSIKRLSHAQWLRLSWRDEGFDLRINRYWNIDLERTEDLSMKEAAQRFAELFADSVRLRLRADVPVGSSLSGGLDSSAVVCQIHALGAAGGQKTFSARMEDPALDEGQHIATVLAKTGVEGHEIWPSAEGLRENFSKLCYHLEEPFLSTSQFAQYLVMRLAAENGVTVLLDGQGADEILAGYRPYFLTRYAEMADEWRLFALWREWRGFRDRHAHAFPLSSKALAARLAPGVYSYVAINRERITSSRCLGARMHAWWNDEWLMQFANEEPVESPQSNRDRLTQKLYADTMGGELQELLRYGDRNSMAWSRELRQPFLDHRIAELLFALPPEYKLFRGETKVIMRKALNHLLPKSILMRQDKLGYQAPLASWVEGPLSEWAEEQFRQASTELSGRIASNVIERLQTKKQPFTESVAQKFFSLLTLAESLRQQRTISRLSIATS
ncbi:MAG: asparagine synthase (glutamine-hydrolyzing) [Acidobacteriota bacterium]